jgi:hypothetical protein
VVVGVVEDVVAGTCAVGVFSASVVSVSVAGVEVVADDLAVGEVVCGDVVVGESIGCPAAWPGGTTSSDAANRATANGRWSWDIGVPLGERSGEELRPRDDDAPGCTRGGVRTRANSDTGSGLRPVDLDGTKEPLAPGQVFRLVAGVDP